MKSRRDTFSRLSSQFRLTVAQGGIGSALYWGVFSYLRLNRFIGLVRDLAAASGLVVAAPQARLELWTAEDVRRWRAEHPEAPTQCFRDVIDGVSAASVALVNGDMAGIIWIYRCGDYSRMFRLGPTDAELNHGTILPAYRGRGLFAAILSHACAWLAAGGFRRVYAAVHVDNRRSLRAFRSAGFVDFARRTNLFLFRPRFPEAKLLPAPDDTRRVAAPAALPESRSA